MGEFYHKIETGFMHMPEHELFIGPREAQASARYLDLSGELLAVVDRASACSAIDMIIEQGEAPSAAHPDAHFVVFDTIRMEYSREVEAAQARGEAFDPVRPVVSNPMTRFYDDTTGGTIIIDPLTHEVAELFNISYDTMLLMLLRFLAHTEETEPELEHLSRATLRLMATVLRPLGEALAMMPVGDPLLPGRTAGPGFGYNRDVHLLPHKASAWVFFAERLRGLAVTAATLRKRAGVPRQVDEAAAALEDLATQFAPSDRTLEPRCRGQAVRSDRYRQGTGDHSGAERAVSRDQRREPGELQGRAPGGASEDGAVPLWWFGEQAVLRRNACPHRFHECEIAGSGGRPP